MERTKGKSYTQAMLVGAVEAVRSKFLTVTKAAQQYSVPRQTISDHVNGKVKSFAKPGGDKMLSHDEEVAVVDYITYMGRRNFPLRRKDIRASIVELIKASGTARVIACKFNLKKGPSDKWFRGFEAEHPEIKWAVPETLQKARSSQSTEYIIDHFFNTYEQVIKSLGLADKPNQIFNADESGIKSHIATREKAYGAAGERLYQEQISNLDHITVMTTISAGGRVLPSFLIYEKNLPCVNVKDEIPKSWLFASSPNGYMDKELFKKWFCNIFLPNCGTERPVLLVIDNHVSHISLEVIEKANENQIHILGLPAHTTHILQPLDIGVFGLVKKKYNSLCLTAGLRSARAIITKSFFPAVWKTAMLQAVTPNVVRSAFQRSGLFPFDPCAIDTSKIKKVQVVHPSLLTDMEAPKINKVTAINSKIAADLDTQPDTRLACDKCGRYAPPLASIIKLPPKLHHAFPCNNSNVNANSSSANKKRRLIPHERVITGEEIRKQVASKEKKMKEEENAKVERKRKREEKQNAKKSSKRKTQQSDHDSSSDRDESSLTFTVDDLFMGANENHTNDGERSSNIEQESDKQVDDSICYICKEEYPPYKGKGKRGRRKKADIDWVQCDNCNHWFHCSCVNVKMNLLGDEYQCPQCICS